MTEPMPGLNELHASGRVTWASEERAVDRRRLLEEVPELRGEFTSMLVHDLRAPLSVITASIEMLGQTETTLTDRARAYLSQMGRSCDRMIRLIADILDLSKLEAHKLSMDPVAMDLSALVVEVVQRFSASAEQHGIRIDMRIPAQPGTVLADHHRLEQVLMNLMANALKFTPGGGTITVEVRPVDDEVEVGIADTGLGITADEMPLLFEKFSQATLGRWSPVSGTGLGLAICRHIIEAHGGRIWADSEPEKGTRFAFRLSRDR
jgi:signal transduction histidine kinase